MRLDEVYHGDSLKAADLAGRDCRVTIAGYEVVDFDEGKKIVLSFEKTDRTFVLNKTNGNTIAENLGTQEMDDWIGKSITLFPTQTDFQGRQVACIRVRIGQPQPPAQATPLTTPPSEPPQQPDYVSGSQDEGGESIPF